MFEAELIIIAILALIEIYLAVETYGQIKDYKITFSTLPILVEKTISPKQEDEGNVEEDLFTDEDSDSTAPLNSGETVIQLESKVGHKTLDAIVNTINSYLINNRGAAIDYHIIKEIINRSIESIEESIEAKLPSPLYIGLAATMVGIIMGLFAIDFDSASIDSIKPLIDGVKVAMFASVLGLFLTTILTIRVYKIAKTQLAEEKNNFISLIQTDLLPSLMGPEQSGMAALANRLDDFGRNTGRAVNDLSKIVNDSSTQVRASQKVLSQIEHLDLNNIAGANEKVFRSLSKMMDSFNSFPGYYQELNQSLGQTTQLVHGLSKLISQSENFDTVIKELREGVEASRQAIVFFNTHIGEFGKYGDAVNAAVESSDEKMAKAISTLDNASQDMFKGFQAKMELYDTQMSKSFETTLDRFNETTLTHTATLTANLKDAQPNFKHLGALENIKTDIEELSKYLRQEATNMNRELLGAINKLTAEIGHIASTNNSGTSEAMPRREPNKENVKKRSTLDLIFQLVVIISGITIISFGMHTLVKFWL